MNLAALAVFIRLVSTAVILFQLVGAIATFKPMRERRIGLSSFLMFAILAVLMGAGRSPLFAPALVPGTLGLVGAVALFVWARKTIHGLFFSYINSKDIPQFVCSNGPYRWIRHPFYASYLLSMLSVAVMFPNPVTAGGSVLAVLALNSAAAFEESKFEKSPVAAEYAAYVQSTGRFLPRLTR